MCCYTNTHMHRSPADLLLFYHLGPVSALHGWVCTASSSFSLTEVTSPSLLLLADAREHMDESVEEYLDDLRAALGVPAEQGQEAAPDDAPSPEARNELERLKLHLHDPVSPGSPHTVLQV